MTPLLLALLISQPVSGPTGFSSSRQLDINSARIAQVESLPVSLDVAQDIYEHLSTFGALNSIYDLRRVRTLPARDFERLKSLVRIVRPTFRREGARYVHTVQRELAAEESPSEAAIEEWQDLVLDPFNINRATVNDLLLLPNVSLVDAVAVGRHLRFRREIRDIRDLRTAVEGLSSYGYRNMRNFVRFDDPPAAGFDGNYRLNYDYDEDWTIQDKLALLAQNLADLADRAKFRNAGFTDDEIDYFERRLQSEQSYLKNLTNQNALRSRLRTRVGNNLRVGLWADKDFNRDGPVNDFKGFATLYDLGVFNKVFIGDYRVTVGQGLMIDNSEDLGSRYYDRTQGLFSDLTPGNLFGFRGAATEFSVPWVDALLFYSRNSRNGIMNPDGTINYYAYTNPVFPVNQDNFNEQNAGGTVRLDLGRAQLFSPGTYLAVNGLTCNYDKDFSPDPKWIDMPDDALLLNDANYTQLTSGRHRQFVGGDFRTVLNNTSLEGEYSRQLNGGSAYLLRFNTQFNYVYLTGLMRHYDASYDNPYNRGFTEMRRFEDLLIERSYRTIDPTWTDMMSFPTPKAEEGVYLETRSQISRQLTLTRAYVDIWRNLSIGLNNYRFQGELEYRPIFPLRIRVKQKIQKKQLAKDVLPTTSLTYETSLRTLASLSGYDFLTGEVRVAKVELTPSLAYNSNTTIWGGFLGITWEHNFSDDFSTETGIAAWQTNGMSQWIFDDVGIDFLDGRGMKYYVTASDRLNDFLLLKVKFMQKLSEYAFTGLSNSTYGFHFLEPSPEPITDFTALRNSYFIGVQLDFMW